MAKTLKDKISDKLVNAFLTNKIISPIPSKFTKKLDEANKFRKLCESKIKDPIIGFKACLLYTSPSPRDATLSRMPSSA